MRALARAKAWIRLVLVHLLYYSGVLHMLRRRRLRGRAVVLMYHRVLTDQERLESFSSDGIQVSPRSFDRQLAFLRRHFNVVSPDEFTRRLAIGEGFADATCLITFDDGWRDNMTNALPLLRKHQTPCVIFLPTDLIGTDRCFWQESLARHLHRLCGVYRREPASVANVVSTYRLETVFIGAGVDLKTRIHDFVRALKTRTDADIEHMMRSVAAAAGPEHTTEHPDRFLTWEEVRHMAQAGVTFGSHAVSHRILTRLPQAEVLAELAGSKQEIAARTGTNVTLLAYPNGDSNSETVEAAKMTGYAAAFTTQHGAVAKGDDRFLLRRVNIHDRATRTRAAFYATLLGVL